MLWASGAASPLNREDILGRNIGASGVFDRRLNGRVLSFRLEGVNVVDGETGSAWSVVGEATKGPLKGTRLEPIVHSDPFWFAWAAFMPQTTIWTDQ